MEVLIPRLSQDPKDCGLSTARADEGSSKHGDAYVSFSDEEKKDEKTRFTE